MSLNVILEDICKTVKYWNLLELAEKCQQEISESIKI